jgi:hypothetical protein
MSLRLAFAIALAVLQAGCAQQPQQPLQLSASSPYASPLAWFCRPDIQGPCSGERRVATLMADGTGSVEAIQPATNPPIDCFYVYPAIS